MENLPTTQNQNLPANSSLSRRLFSWVVNSGQFVISLSETASKKWADHKGRVAAAESMGQLLLEEGKAAVELKSKLVEKLIGANEIEAAQIRLVLNQIDANIRTIGILNQANNEVKAITSKASEPKDNADQDINSYWLDRFFDLTKLKNEPWRANLLSKALALETTNPGQIALETLWKIGTLSENSFHTLAHVLDVSVLISDVPIIINPSNKFYGTKIQGSMIGKDATYGVAVLLLGEAGLVHLPMSLGTGASRNYPGAGKISVSYGSKKDSFTVTKEFSLRGIIFTELGLSLAKLYEAGENDVGHENYMIAKNELIKLGCLLNTI